MVHVSRRQLASAAALVLAATLAPAWTAPPASAVSPDLVISQVYGGGSNAGASHTHDFIEVYNRGATTVDLTGWSVQYSSAAGTGTFASNSPTALAGVLPPGEHYLVQQSGGTVGSPLPTPDATGTIAMSGTAGKVVVVRPGTPLGLACNGSSDPCDAGETARIADLVGYGTTANFSEGTPTANLSATTAALRNGAGATDTDNNAADFTIGTPTPRNCGEDCEPPDPCETAPTVQIHDVQGNGNTSPFTGECVITTGVVTGDFNGTGGLGGFYMQGQQEDADPLTSEGVFVASTTAVSAGDLVSVTGIAAETFGETQLTGATVEVTSTGNSVAATSYDLPRPDGVTFEPVEGMLLTFPEALTATEHFQLGRFGEVTVSSDGRLRQPTDVAEPGAPAQALLAEAARRRLLIDDGSNVQNPANVPFLSPTAVRIGDTATGVTGVLGFGFGLYRLQPTAPITFTRVNDRPAAPADVGGDLKVASFNTLNYFTTLSTENPDARGANSPAEFARQQIKEVQAITGLDADVIGLMEVENNGAEAIGSLVEALNDATAPGTYAFIDAPAINPPNEFGGTFGTDAIKVALIYRPAAVTPVGAALTSTNAVFDRPPLIQTFARSAGSGEFTAVVNHFKSKNCAAGSDPLDQDQGDGQSCFNNRRVLQAEALVDVLDTLAVSNPLILGDLNSYTEEDPIHTLEDAGYTGLSQEFIDTATRYSFVFDGFSGELDHALAGAGLLDNVTGTTIWHINADEPLMLDYNLDFGRSPALFEENAFRASDHDPLIVGLALNETPTVDAGGPYTVVEGSSVDLGATGSDPLGDDLTYAWDLDGNGSFETTGQDVTFSAAALQAPVTKTVTVQVSDPEGLVATDTAEVRVIWDFVGFTGTVQDPPAVAGAQGGATVNVQFSLDGNQGLAVLAAGSPTSQLASCTTWATSGPVEPTAAKARPPLTYSADTDLYTYAWKTEKSWRDTCRLLTVTLADGTSHSARVSFGR